MKGWSPREVRMGSGEMGFLCRTLWLDCAPRGERPASLAHLRPQCPAHSTCLVSESLTRSRPSSISFPWTVSEKEKRGTGAALPRTRGAKAKVLVSDTSWSSRQGHQNPHVYSKPLYLWNYRSASLTPHQESLLDSSLQLPSRGPGMGWDGDQGVMGWKNAQSTKPTASP